MVPVYKKGKATPAERNPTIGLGPSMWNEGAKIPVYKKAGRTCRGRAGQGVARTQVFGMKEQNWVRLAKTCEFQLILSCIYKVYNLEREAPCHRCASASRAKSGGSRHPACAVLARQAARRAAAVRGRTADWIKAFGLPGL